MDDDLSSIQYSSDDESWPMLLSELNLYKEKLTLAKHLLADQNEIILNITSRFNLLVEGEFYFYFNSIIMQFI